MLNNEDKDKRFDGSSLTQVEKGTITKPEQAQG